MRFVKMKFGFLFGIPVAVSGHGIAMPLATNLHEMKKAGSQAVKEIEKALLACSEEVIDCAPAVLRGWEAGAHCLVEQFETVKDENCQDHIIHAARHLPAALYASGKHNIDDGEPHLKSTAGVADFGKRVNRGCNVNNDVLPYVWSYHLHIQWDFGCHSCKQTAMDFTDKFLAEFQPGAQMCHRMAFLTDLWNTNSIPRNESERHQFADICTMGTLPPGGPFYHSEKGFALSPIMFHKALPWLMANRPLNDKLYMFVHPNTGCQFNDLSHWSAWVGPSVSMFHALLKGCVWSSCEDQVLGCIGFNHLTPTQGYGQCYTPPSEFYLGCTMSLEPHSNTSTIDCVEGAAAPAVV